MKSLLVLSVLLASCYSLPIHLDSNTTSYSEKECGSSFEKLWLEVVFVVDNSKEMTNEGLAKVVASMKSALQGATIGLRSYPQTTRVGLVTYNSKATVVAGLNTYTSYDDFSAQVSSALATVSDELVSHLSEGFFEASQLFDRWSIPNRKQFQKVVIAYTNSYKYANSFSNPLDEADNLKQKGVQIITVAMTDDETVNSKLEACSTPPYHFKVSDSQLTGDIQKALLAMNCFCPSGGWVQFRETYGDFVSRKYATCIYPGTSQMTWIQSMKKCSTVSQQRGFLLNELSYEKHAFAYQIFKHHWEIAHPARYHIGLSYYNNAWLWEQPQGLHGQPATFTYWNPGFPVADNSKLGVMNVETLNGAAWENINLGLDQAYFACEVAACDTENYCDSSVAK